MSIWILGFMKLSHLVVEKQQNSKNYKNAPLLVKFVSFFLWLNVKNCFDLKWYEMSRYYKRKHAETLESIIKIFLRCIAFEVWFCAFELWLKFIYCDKAIKIWRNKGIVIEITYLVLSKTIWDILSYFCGLLKIYELYIGNFFGQKWT